MLLAKLAALIAPAEVPQTMRNGLGAPRGRIRAMARNTPTWYAARAPPPLMINATLGRSMSTEFVTTCQAKPTIGHSGGNRCREYRVIRPAHPVDTVARARSLLRTRLLSGRWRSVSMRETFMLRSVSIVEIVYTSGLRFPLSYLRQMSVG